MAISYSDNPNVENDVDLLSPEIISKEVELKSQEEGFRRFREFVVYKEDLRKQPGETLNIPKVANLRRAQDLSETSALRGTGSKLTVSHVQFTPAEIGDEVQYTEYSQLVTIIDLQDLIVELLSRQATKRENLDVRDAAFAGTNIRYAGGVNFENSVTAQIGSADVDYVVEELETNESQKYAGGDTFVGFVHPYAKTALKNNLTSTSDYAHAVPHLYAGEIGMYNRTRFIETAYCPFGAWIQGSDLVDNGYTWTITNWNTRVVENDTYCKSESWTLTYTKSNSRYSIYGTQTGSAYFHIGGATAPGALQYFTAAELAGSTIYVTTSATASSDTHPIRFNTGAFAAAAGAASETLGFASQRQVRSLIMGERHLAMGVIKPVTMLGVEKWDYGRVIGVAWNAFWQMKILNQDYGYIIDSKR